MLLEVDLLLVLLDVVVCSDIGGVTSEGASFVDMVVFAVICR